MKTYVFLAFSIDVMGGGQCYVAGKAKYLESEGWRVVVISQGDAKSRRRCAIPYLEKFIRHKSFYVDASPHLLPRFMVRWGLKEMEGIIGNREQLDGEIIIESHGDRYALWGEMLARHYGAKHVFLTLNEVFRGPGRYYLDKIDFFRFKYERKEVFGTVDTVRRLFEGVLDIDERDIPIPQLDEDPFQDISSPAVDAIVRADYNICHIGRANKEYVGHMIQGVAGFAQKHPDQSVQLICVGDMAARREMIEAVRKENSNLTVTELGFMSPIPRPVLEKADAVIACSGSARHSAEEGALTIIADAESGKALGLLGYDTNNSLYVDKDSVVTTFCEALERALVEKVHLSMNYKYPPKRGVAACTKQNFDLIAASAQEKSYYDKKKLLEGKVDMRNSIKLLGGIIAHKAGIKR